MWRGACGLAFLGALPASVAAQDSTLLRAKQAYEELNYETAVRLSQQALRQRLPAPDRIAAYELLGFAWASLDSTRRAIGAFGELLRVDPDHELDPDRVSPRIIALFGSALGQVLVVRQVRLDSTSFVAGQGFVTVRFSVSRPARVITSVVGQGRQMTVDSQSIDGGGVATWSATDADGVPVPPGEYQLILEASSGNRQFASEIVLEVDHAPVDTLRHVSAIEGWAFQPETEIPGRNWRPLGLASVYTAFVAGASLALENTRLDLGDRREIAGVSIFTLLTGFIMSLKKPDPQPIPGNILYNQLLREQIAERNRAIALDNDQRRQQRLITVVPRATQGGQ